MPQHATTSAAAAAAPMPPAYPNFGQRFPETNTNQAVRGDQQTGDAGMAALTLLGQVAQLSPPAVPAGQGGGATAAAGVGGATGGPNLGQTGIYSNVGGNVNRAIARAGGGPPMPGGEPARARRRQRQPVSLRLDVLTSPQSPLPVARRHPRWPMGGTPNGPVVPVPQRQQAAAAGAPLPRQGAGPRGFAATTAAANAGARGVQFGATDQFGLPIPPAAFAQAQARPPPPPLQAQAATQAAATAADSAAARRAVAQHQLGLANRAGGTPPPPPLIRAASSVPRRSDGSDRPTDTTTIRPHVWSSPPPVVLQVDAKEQAPQRSTTKLAAVAEEQQR